MIQPMRNREGSFLNILSSWNFAQESEYGIVGQFRDVRKHHIPNSWMWKCLSSVAMLIAILSGLGCVSSFKIEAKCGGFWSTACRWLAPAGRGFYFADTYQAITLPQLRERSSLANFISVEPCIWAKPAWQSPNTVLYCDNVVKAISGQAWAVAEVDFI